MGREGAKEEASSTGGRYRQNDVFGRHPDCMAVYGGTSSDAAGFHGRPDDGRAAGCLGAYLCRADNSAKVFVYDGIPGDECRRHGDGCAL